MGTCIINNLLMKNNYMKTALKAMKKQREVYQTDRDRFEVDENSAKKNKELCEAELMKLDKQIKELEANEVLALT